MGRTALQSLGRPPVVVRTVPQSLGRPPVVRQLFCYPETLGLVMAGQLLIGRYTGYRLLELFRFRDFLRPRPPGAPPAEESVRPLAA